MKMCSSSKESEPLAVNKTIVVAKQVEMAKMFKEKVIFFRQLINHKKMYQYFHYEDLDVKLFIPVIFKKI